MVSCNVKTEFSIYYYTFTVYDNLRMLPETYLPVTKFPLVLLLLLELEDNNFIIPSLCRKQSEYLVLAIHATIVYQTTCIGHTCSSTTA
jgi:hypothetical protein